MRGISSHPAIEMRVLILSAAILACATGAPSGALVTPLAAVVPAIPLKTATINAGDLQGALIDAKVQAEDLIRAAIDKNREATEQVIENTNEKVVENTDLAKERSLEAFWAGEEQKWQALDALKTAEAQIDGQIASTSDVTAKSLVIPPVVGPIGPVVAPISPYLYGPGIITPGLSTFSSGPIVTFHPETPKVEEKKEEVKTVEKPEEIKSDTVQIESADVKTEKKPAEGQEILDSKYVIGQTQLLASLPLNTLKLASPWLGSPVGLIQPGLRTVLPYPNNIVAAPIVYKTVW